MYGCGRVVVQASGARAANAPQMAATLAFDPPLSPFCAEILSALAASGMFRSVPRSRLLRLLGVALLVIALAASPLAAQDMEPDTPPAPELGVPLYGLGDWITNVRLGLFTPLFLAASTPINGQTLVPTNLTLGGSLALTVATYLTPNINVGLEVAGSLAWDIYELGFFLVPILAKGAYVFSTPELEVPVSVGLGAAIMRLGQETTGASLLLRPGVGVLWRATATWSLGGSLEYWLAWELLPQTISAEQQLLGNFLDITASAVYHF